MGTYLRQLIQCRDATIIGRVAKYPLITLNQNFNLGQCHSLFSIIFPLLTLKLITFYFLSAAKEDPIKPVAKPSTAEANKEKSKVKPEEPKSKPASDKDVVVCSSEFLLL